MLRHTILLLFLYGIRSSTGRPQNEVAEAREQIQRERIKESEVGAGGSGEVILRNFRNPVLEYLKLSAGDSRKEGLVREIRHGQTLVVPGGTIPSAFPSDGGSIIDGQEKSVTSPVLQLNKTEGVWTKTETFPAAAVVVSTYNPDGSLKSSVTHFRPLGVPAIYGASLQQPLTTDSGPSRPSPPPPPPQRINWPFANYFPIVVNDPFLAAYNGITSGMYNTFSTMIEYGPEADICRKKENRKTGEEFDEVTLDAELKLVKPSTEMTGESRRRRRDTTGIELSFKNGDRVNVKVEEPKFRSGLILPAEAEERTRAHTVMLVNPPPFSSLMKPSENGLMKKGTKPQKYEKEMNESGSEEVGEEAEDATQSGPNDGVAISPPPDGASIAEAKPVGLAIAGPGGLAAAKPQGTAVAGPGGLAIARPIGTAIAGVEVEGAVPIGGQQKNKNKNKKPKQEPQKMDDDADSDSELHYVGGLTGPIGNPQPNTKDFGKESPVKSRSQENLLFQGKYNSNGYQLKLGEQDGKYGFVPLMASPLRSSDTRIQKRMDNPTFFHGLLGNRNFQGHFQQGQLYPDFYY